MSIFISIVGLALLIVIHEFGHFIVARLCGMRVERFSVGFGNPLFKFEKGGTIFQIAPIPLGGFVQITGLNPHEEFDTNDPYVYPNRPVWMRMAVLVAGPLANYLTAFLLIIPLTIATGLPTDQTKIAEVQKESAAAEAGMLAEDVILRIDGKEMRGPGAIPGAIQAAEGAQVTVTVLREGKEANVSLTPRKVENRWLLGIQLTPVLGEATVAQAVTMAPGRIVDSSISMFNGILDIFRKNRLGDVGGPVAIVKQMAMAASNGVWTFVNTLVFLSIYLGLFNLLPIPALDGGRLVFLLGRAIHVVRFSEKKEASVHMVGMLLLLGVFVIVTFKDIFLG